VRHFGDVCEREIGQLVLHCEVELTKLSCLLKQSCSYSAHEIEKDKLVSAKGLLNNSTEHPQRKHVKKQVLETAMHKHVGEKLVYSKVGSKEKMQAQQVV